MSVDVEAIQKFTDELWHNGGRVAQGKQYLRELLVAYGELEAKTQEACAHYIEDFPDKDSWRVRQKIAAVIRAGKECL